MPDWRIKALTQKTISLLPRGESINYLLQRYLTRSMVHTDHWFATNLDQLGHHVSHWREFGSADRPPVRALEIGTGWYPMVPLGLALIGTDEVLTVDRTGLLRPQNVPVALRAALDYARSGRFEREVQAPVDSARVRVLEQLCRRERVPATDLEQLGIRTIIGDARQLDLDAGSVELFVSNNVFEHVAGEVLLGVLTEYRRLAAPEAVMSHFVDLLDHFFVFDRSISSRNYLRFSERQWRFWDNDIVPQTRLMPADYRRLHTDSGFRIVSEDAQRAPDTALDGFAIAPEFAHHPREELLVETVWLASVPAS